MPKITLTIASLLRDRTSIGVGIASMMRLRLELRVQARVSVPGGELAKPGSKERD
jgi:hypothetical protein